MGGVDALSEAEKSLIRRASSLELQLEMLEHKWALADYQADHQDLQVYQRVTNSLRRLLESLGLQRRARDVNLSLRDKLLVETRSA
jgi:hypothetical protein